MRHVSEDLRQPGVLELRVHLAAHCLQLLEHSGTSDVNGLRPRLNICIASQVVACDGIWKQSCMLMAGTRCLDGASSLSPRVINACRRVHTRAFSGL